MEFSDVMQMSPYSLSKHDKELLHANILFDLIKHHYDSCDLYRRYLDAIKFDPETKHDRQDLPFLPINIFKSERLMSVELNNVVRTLTSSGTSGQGLSKVFLDRSTAINQKKALSNIVTDIIGNKRIPLLVVDSPSVISDPKKLAARGAAIIGFSMFANNVTYALAESMEPNWSAIEEFTSRYKGKDFMVFGFTFILWDNLIRKMIEQGKTLDLSRGVLIHGGGWKKAVENAVDKTRFKASVREALCIERVHNYYGMVEQTGSIYLECEYGYLHSSIFSDVSVVDSSFSELEFMESGMLKLTSLIPTSYPGNIILTEDLGRIVGEDSCLCGRLGKFFEIHGRIPEADLRGCSDTRE